MAAANEKNPVRSLATRLQDLPGVESVEIEIDNGDSDGIHVRLEPGADQKMVMEQVQALLAAYGVRPTNAPPVRFGTGPSQREVDLGVDVRITPVKGGARVEVLGRKVRAFRIVPPNATAVAQGLADAWCAVLGKIPVEIARVGVGDRGELTVVASDGVTETIGRADVAHGWESALARAVGEALGVTSGGGAREVRLTSNAW